MNKEKLGKNAIFLIASDLIYTITALFAQTFLVAYLLKITNDNITQVSLYYMIINFIHAMGSIFIGKFIKNGKYNKTKILSLGIIIRAIFILFIVLLGNKLSNMFVIVAIFCGISETLYWSAHEIIFVEITNNENRKSYMATKKIASTIVNIVAPIILGSTIELYSFTKIAIYVLALSIIQIVLSFQIKIDSKVNVKTTKFSLKNYINTIKTKKGLKVHKYYKSNLLYGIVEDPMKTLVTIITIMTFKTSLNLGILTTIFSIFQIAVMYLYKKFYNKSNAKYILFAVSSLIFIGAMGLVIDIDKITLIIYNFACTTGLCIFDAIYNTQKGDLIKECNIEQYDVEHVMFNSILTCSSRFIGFSLILIVGIIDNMVFFKGLLAVIAILVLIYSRIIINMEEKKTMKN
ncbi:MAG: MFS transporter [Clostridia bacterium]|jgi:membrane protein